jgi:hypothetical protein
VGWRERFIGLGTWWVVVGLVLVVFGVFPVFFEVGNRTVWPHGPGVEGMPNVTDLQRAFSEEDFKGVLAEWSGQACAAMPDAVAGDEPDCVVPEGTRLFPDGVEAFKRNLILIDYTFPIAYVVFGIGLLAWAWGLGESGRRRFLPWLWAAPVAGASDWAENTLHLAVLRDVHTYADASAADLNEPLIALAAVFAHLKYGLIFVAIGAFVVGLGWRAVRWVRAG